MKMLKKLAVLLLAIACGLTMFTACKGEKLDRPTGISIDDSYRVTWNTVSKAKSYVIDIKNANSGESEDESLSTTSYSLAPLKEGDYEIRIMALGADGAASDWSATVYFQREKETGCIYSSIGKSGYELTRAGASSGQLELGDTYRGKPIIRIAARAFKGSSQIESIEIGKYVESIGDDAFFNCKRLTSVTLPDSLTSIGTAAFQGCSLLEKVTIPENVTAISDYTFAYCRGLKKVEFNDKLTSIGSMAFFSCSALKEVEIPDSVATIAEAAFQANSELTSVEFGASLETIGEGAFSSNNKMTTLIFVNDSPLKTIGESAFYSCSELTTVTLPENVEEIGASAFAYCSKLEEINIPNSVMNLGSYAFSATKFYIDAVNAGEEFIYADDWLIGCLEETKKTIEEINDDTFDRDVKGIADAVFAGSPNLSVLTIPDSVRVLGKHSFYFCPNLSIVEINSSNTQLVSVGRYAFMGCSSLTQLNFGGDNSVLKTIDSYAFYGCTLLDNNAYYSIIPASVTTIGTFAFRNTGLWNKMKDGIVYAGNWVVGYDIDSLINNRPLSPTVVLDSSTVGISNYAFYGYEPLQAIEGLENVRNIGYGAFYACTRLATISLPRRLTKIEDFTFYGCRSLFQLGGGKDCMPAGVKEIGKGAFYGCSLLNFMDLSNGKVEKIGDRAFYGCTNMQTIDLGDDLTEIGERAFYQCSSLKEVIIPDGVTTIKNRTFYKCENLKSLTMGQKVETIDDYAFYSCSSLDKIELPDSVKSIGDKAFYNCKNVTVVRLGAEVETIGDYAFFNLSNVTRLTIPTSVKSIGKYAFKGWKGLNSLVLDSTVNEIDVNAFYGIDCTIYTDAEKSIGWNARWNSSQRPVVWGCTLSEDGSYVESVTMNENSISYANAKGGITAPERMGYEFVGWATSSGATTAEYTAAALSKVPYGTTVYAVWKPL